MFRRTLLQCVTKKKLFELYCREQLLTNFSLRELQPAERKVAMTASFKEISAETLHDLQQRAAIEESRLEALQRAAATFKPLTPYEFFVKEQRNNPALGSSSNPREREVRLLQVYETLPEKAREALATRAERYNAEGAKLPAAPAMPVVRVVKKKEAPVKVASKKSKKKKALKKKKKGKMGAAAKNSTAASEDAEGENGKKKKKKTIKSKGAVSPYAIFVKEQMASLHHLVPTERMRVIGERWRSLTNEERQRRLEAARVKIASEAAAATPTTSSEASVGGASPAAPAESTSTVSASPAPSAAAPAQTTSGSTASGSASTPTPSSSASASSPAALPEKKAESSNSPTPQPNQTSPAAPST